MLASPGDHVLLDCKPCLDILRSIFLQLLLLSHIDVPLCLCQIDQSITRRMLYLSSMAPNPVPTIHMWPQPCAPTGPALRLSRVAAAANVYVS